MGRGAGNIIFSQYYIYVFYFLYRALTHPVLRAGTPAYFRSASHNIHAANPTGPLLGCGASLLVGLSLADCCKLHLCLLGSQNVLHRPIWGARQTMPRVSLICLGLNLCVCACSDWLGEGGRGRWHHVTLLHTQPAGSKQCLYSATVEKKFPFAHC